VSKAVTSVLGFLGHLRPRLGPEESIFADWDSGWYHNSAAALATEHGVVSAVEEERLTRKKNTGVFPAAAIAACLARADGRLDLVAYGERGGFGELRDPSISAEAVYRMLVQSGLDMSSTAVTLIDHHTSHAYSAAMSSGFDDALVVTLDGFGDGISGSFRMMTGGALSPPYRMIPFRASLGRFYSSVLSYLGYRDGDEYKVMGLAPCGNSARFEGLIGSLYALAEAGSYQILDHDQDSMYQRLLELGPERPPGGEVLPHHADVAASIQDALQRVTLHLLRHEIGVTGARFLCLAGGVAHNSAMVGHIQRDLKLENLFVQPAADDSGIAVGAAYAGLDELGIRPKRGLPHVFLGPGVEDGAITAATARWADWISVERMGDPVEVVAQLLAGNSVVGVARGPMEFGPRALGNRSILADPRHAENKDRVNRLVKSRESFRPFAPAAPQEDAPRLFELDLPASAYRFMTIVTRVRHEYRDLLPAVTHIDGSARLQTVARSTSPFFHAVLRRFGELTGVPVLLNTSLNNNREPIVATPEDAIRFLLTSGVDCLLMGDLIIRRAPSRTRAGLLRGARAVLTSGSFAAANGRSYVVVGPERREIKVGRAAFAALTGHGDLADAADDLFLLWTERLIDIVPGPVLITDGAAAE
jgi:carbamoyltransferase